ncbi:TPA: hypothetical protein IAB95_06955 [Candidatus Ventrenecus avicola]|nr:hypothetical protein [Candidatus Ventrenecus avicola]
MNKIVKKLLIDLDNYPKTENELIKQNVDYIQRYFLGSDLDGDHSFMFTHFRAHETILNNTSLTKKEKGYIFLELLSKNFSIIDVDGALALEYDRYETELRSIRIYNEIVFANRLIDYLEDPTKPTLYQQVLKNVLEKEEQRSMELKKYYKNIRDALSVKPKTKETYERIKENMFALEIPESLILDVLTYLKEKEHLQAKREENLITKRTLKPKEKEPTPSKKILKAELAKYYQPEIEEPQELFDYQNYLKVLFILKQLNYTEERTEEILNWIFLHAKKTFSYFAYLYDKLKYSKRHKELLEEINFYFSNMWICSDEDYLCAKETIMNLLNCTMNVALENYQYEIELMKKM